MKLNSIKLKMKNIYDEGYAQSSEGIIDSTKIPNKTDLERGSIEQTTTSHMTYDRYMDILCK